LGILEVYLPIAGISLDVVGLLLLGAAVGFLSGVLGVGGGFLLTPLLIFIGVPSPVAVASSANQLVGASLTGALAYWRRGGVDFLMGVLMLAGGLAGSAAGVWLFALLRRSGQIELVISLSYAALLAVLGTLMLIESSGAWLRRRRPGGQRHKLHQHNWLHGLPLKLRFRRSKLYISALLPILLGFLVGMPTAMVPGTSLFQIIFVTAAVTILQAVANNTVDVVLALLLLLGGVIGAQLGSRWGAKLRGEELRALLALILLAVAAKLVFDLTARPAFPFSIAPVEP
jgi:uncharacterized membrane protein YfcA